MEVCLEGGNPSTAFGGSPPLEGRLFEMGKGTFLGSPVGELASRRLD